MFPLPAIPILFSVLLAPQAESLEIAGGVGASGEASAAASRTVRVVRPARAVRASRLVRAPHARTTVRIPEGSYRPLYGRTTDKPVRVASFRMDRNEVTREAFLAFVTANPEWRRSAVRAAYADRGAYLAGWRGDLDAGDASDLRRPVTGISWFAAKAFCVAQGKRLPTVAEWEYVAAASATSRDASRDPAFVQHLLTLYATRPRPLPPVDRGALNVHGVRGLHGLAWEWVADFNRAHVSSDSHGVGGPGHDVSCASAAIGAADASNYPAFLRSALRTGLTGRSSLETLGFRCAA